MSLVSKVLAGAVPVIVVLVAAAFVPTPGMPPFLRQALLCAIGLGGIVAAEVLLFGGDWPRVARSLGAVAPRWRAVGVVLLVSLPMWLALPLWGLVTGTPITVNADWLAIVLGIVLVNGIAEEAIHRAFLFGHLRDTMNFARAASISAAVFALQHFYLVATVGLAPGLFSVLLALGLAYPMAFIYERNGRSLVAPAVLHTSTNAPVILFAAPGAPGILVPYMGVILASCALVFLFRQWLDAEPAPGVRPARATRGA